MNDFGNNARFAFTVFDDTDDSTVENTAPVYGLLQELGMRTTKSVWPLAPAPMGRHGGASLQDSSYSSFVLGLQRQGFEIAMHSARNHDSSRETVQKGLEAYREILGSYPRSYSNHSYNRENIYWGSSRLNSPSLRIFYNLATGFHGHGYFQGHEPSSNHFWGDLCRQHIHYVRNFVFDEINLDRIDAARPYHDSTKPYVKFWFSSCDGGDVARFCKAVDEEHQDRLEAEGGVCIMYAHFAAGFCNGRLDPRFERLMRRLGRKKGWFVPVSTLLDHLRKQRPADNIDPQHLALLEKRWLLSKMRAGRS